MMVPVHQEQLIRVRPGFPFSAVTLFLVAGYAAGWALGFMYLWLDALASRYGWWPADRDDDTVAVGLPLTLALAIPAALLTWAGWRRCRRHFGYARLSTQLIGAGTIFVGAALVLAL